MGAMSEHRVIFADSRKMPELDDESIDLVVTSPPYWRIKDYAHPGQIGYDQTYEAYLSDLRSVLSECHRALRPGCRAAFNVGDQYLRASEHGRYRVQPIPADIIMIARAVGFDFMGNIIWQKTSTTNTTGGGCWMGSVYYPKDGHVTYEHEYIVLLRKRGQWRRPSVEQKEKSRLTREQRSAWFRGIWRIPPRRQDSHVAMFPVELPRRLIKMYSFCGETVLDPFLGSGTTTLAAMMEGRASVGYEINRAFEPLIREKTDAEGSLNMSYEPRSAPVR
ncbi:MAG: site-specific DNA-methyltransferase [Planctomycetes bacterium]|nr:site-specific DNA-methyltransferase [Planctomycetota bacterium]